MAFLYWTGVCGSLYGVVLCMAGVKKHRLPATGAQEYLCQCPRCLTLEPLWFKADVLIATVKFSQGNDSKVYHTALVTRG